MTVWQTRSVYYRKIGGVWVRTDQVAAVEIGQTGINVHLTSGSRVTLNLDRTQEALDEAVKLIAREEKIP